jgi:hypothetical protein
MASAPITLFAQVLPMLDDAASWFTQSKPFILFVDQPSFFKRVHGETKVYKVHFCPILY